MKIKHTVAVALSVIGVYSAVLFGMSSISVMPAVAGTTGSVAKVALIDFNNSNTSNILNNASKYSLMVLQADNTSSSANYSPTINAEVRQANPNITTLVYQAGFVSRPTDPTGLTVCLTNTQAQSNPAWFLYDSTGSTIPVPGSSTEANLDFTDSTFLPSCSSHAVNLAKTDGFNGIMWDLLNDTMCWTLPSSGTDACDSHGQPSGTCIQAYESSGSYLSAGNSACWNNTFNTSGGFGFPCPNSATYNVNWQCNVYSFLSYVSSQDSSNGLTTVGNIGDLSKDPSLWDAWSGVSDGSTEQIFTDNGNKTFTSLSTWQGALADEVWNEAHHKIEIANPYSTTEAGNTYGIATMMLAANGYSYYADNNYTWYPEFDTAAQLGSPTGNYVQLSGNIYERTFSNGLDIVNPNSSPASTINLSGSYTGSCGSGTLTNITSITPAANTGCLLIANPTPSSPSGGTTNSGSGSTASTSSSTNAPQNSAKNTSSSASSSHPSSTAPSQTTTAVIGSTNSSQQVSGEVQLSTGSMTSIKSVIYYLDGKRIYSSKINTKDLWDGKHTIEAIITKTNGQVIRKISILNVDNHNSILKNAELRYGKAQVLIVVWLLVYIFMSAWISAYWLKVIKPNKSQITELEQDLMNEWHHSKFAAQAASMPGVITHAADSLPVHLPGTTFKPTKHTKD